MTVGVPITLGVGARDRIWRSADPNKPRMYYRWENDHWECYTDDPRYLRLDSISAPAGGVDANGNLRRETGFVEVP